MAISGRYKVQWRAVLFAAISDTCIALVDRGNGLMNTTWRFYILDARYRCLVASYEFDDSVMYQLET